MSGTRIAFVLLALAFAGATAWGIKTGIMPERVADIDRRKYPTLFWIGAGLYILFSLLCLYAAATA